MRSLYLLILVLFTLPFAACSDESISPDNNNTGDNRHGLEIIGVNQNEVYWGDTLSVLLRNARSDVFTAFLHTIQLKVIDSWRDTTGLAGMKIVIPNQAESATIRVYEFDSVQARGTAEITVFPQNSRTLFPEAHSSWPDHAYAGDFLVISGVRLPLRKSDVAVKVNGVELPIVWNDSQFIYTRVLPEVKTGPVSVRLFDNTTNVGILAKHEVGGEIFQERGLNGFQISASYMKGLIKMMEIIPGDTIHSSASFSDSDLMFLYDSVGFIPKGDSLIVVASGAYGSYTYALEMRLKPEAENKMSGRIRASYTTFEQDMSVEAQLNKIRWIKEGSSYVMRSFSTDVPEQLDHFSGTASYISPDEDYKAIQTFELDGAERNAVLTLIFTQ